MNISEGLLTQMKRYEKTGAFQVNHNLAVELSNLNKEIRGGGLNYSCKTCVAEALSFVYGKYKEQEKPKQEPKKKETTEQPEEVKKEFKGVEQYDFKSLKKMKVADLKQFAKDKNIELTGTTKAEIIKEILKTEK